MASFEKCIPHILRHEGGYVFDPDDPGGETNFGISKRAFPEIDIKKLTIEDAKKIYLHDYWARMRLHDIKSDRLSLHIFDHGVNVGTGRAIYLVQHVAGVEIDGKIGPKTIEGINNVVEQSAIDQYSALRIEYYNRIVLQKPSLQKFLKGWKSRVSHCNACKI